MLVLFAFNVFFIALRIKKNEFPSHAPKTLYNLTLPPSSTSISNPALLLS